jgi:subtilisin family serine protease
MNRRLLLALAAVLAVGACNEQQEPNTGGSNPGDFASTSGTIGINVVLKARATAANRTELAKYGTLLDEIAELNAIRVRAKSDQLPAIQALPFIKSATPDAARNAAPIDLVSAEDFLSGANAWDQDAINVTDFGAGRTLPNGYNGDGVNVAILDTGLLPTWQQYFPQERIRVDYAKTFGGGGQDNLNVSEPPNKWEADVNSHGTHVTSTILGYQFPGLGQFNGVAPLTKIIPVKVLNQNGSGWSSAIARGINYVADLKRNDPLLKGSPMVINMSLGGGSPDALEQAAIDDAIAAGVIIVASAGNNGDAGMGWPGAFPEVISAAASGWSKQFVSCAAAGQPSNAGGWWRACDYPENTSEVYIANFSAREKPGQDLDVVAPGSWVVGPYQTNQSNKMSLFFLSGTSMASPHVAGIVALMAQQNPSLTASQAEATLESRATPLAKGCATVINEAEQQCWDTDATGSGLITATAALGLSTGGRRR